MLTTPDLAKVAAMIPADLKLKLDEAELKARLDYWATLDRTARASEDAAFSRANWVLATKALNARPTAEVNAEIARWEAAARAQETTVDRRGYYQLISDLRRDNPRPPDQPRLSGVTVGARLRAQREREAAVNRDRATQLVEKSRKAKEDRTDAKMLALYKAGQPDARKVREFAAMEAETRRMQAITAANRAARSQVGHSA